jgi:putative NADH-flavin reductase
MKKVCIVGASGKLGQYMVQHALDRGYEVVGVCRAQSVGKLDAFKDQMALLYRVREATVSTWLSQVHRFAQPPCTA